MNKAIFLDRDGVINELIFNSERNEYEPPHKKEDLKLFDGVIEALIKFQEDGYKLFLISNQPDY
ncbi:MAG: HAD family hydrolase, partial [Ignavibacteria bacterium]